MPRFKPIRHAGAAGVTCACVLFASPAFPQQAGSLAVRSCGLAGIAARCGVLRVPEDPGVPNGRQLDLHLRIIPRAGVGTAREPVFLIKGGPGEAATAGSPEDLVERLARVRANHDLVLIDQRGTGGSNALACDVADGHFLVPRDPKACLAQLTSRADLRMYSTARFIDDLEAVRAALDYPQISLYGGSYGSRAAYAYARRYPTRVRSLVLVAPAPPTMPLVDSFEEDGARALALLVSDCAVDRACARAFPTLAADLRKVQQELRDPLHVIGLQLLQYASTTSRLLPLLISEAARGNRVPLTDAIAQTRRQIADRLSLGLHLSINCSEELAATPRSRTGPVTALRAEYDSACQGWPTVDVPPSARTPVHVDRPVLLLVGAWDPVTSPRWAKEMAALFPSPHLVIVPKEGHILEGPIDACLDIVAATFLDRGTPDKGCISRHRRPAYALSIR